MANFYAKTKSNKFMVTDKEKAELILSSIQAEDKVHYDLEIDSEGNIVCDFAVHGCIQGLSTDYASNGTTNNQEEEDTDAEIDFLIKELQSILADGSYIIITECGYEKLSYVGGGCYVATKDKFEYLDLNTSAKKLALSLLASSENN